MVAAAHQNTSEAERLARRLTRLPVMSDQTDILLRGITTRLESLAKRLANSAEAVLLFAVVAGLLLVVVFVIGVLLRWDWLIALATSLIGLLAAALLLVFAIPGAFLIAAAETFPSFKTALKAVVLGLLWALLLALYFLVVPISENPRAIALVVLISFILALMWLGLGISPNPRRVYGSVITILVITTAGVFFPNTFRQLLLTRGRLDEKLADCIARPSSCFGGSAAVQSPASRDILVEIKSEPPGANVYLDWSLKGQTPVRLTGRNIAGFLVVAADGYEPHFEAFQQRADTSVALILLPEQTRSTRNLLLVPRAGVNNRIFDILRTSLVDEGFMVGTLGDATEFERTLRQAGALTNTGLRAWARAQFDTDRLVTATMTMSTQDLGEKDFGLEGVAAAVRGVFRSDTRLEMQVFDLRTGRQLASVVGTGSSMKPDSTRSQRAAVQEAITNGSELFRRRFPQ